MTGGLWRLTGQQIADAAAAASLDDDDDDPASPAGAGASPAVPSLVTLAGDAEDVRGPHASLAVRLAQRDPDRAFVLGERLNYVLLLGALRFVGAGAGELGGLRASFEGFIYLRLGMHRRGALHIDQTKPHTPSPAFPHCNRTHPQAPRSRMTQLRTP